MRSIFHEQTSESAALANSAPPPNTQTQPGPTAKFRSELRIVQSQLTLSHVVCTHHVRRSCTAGSIAVNHAAMIANLMWQAHLPATTSSYYIVFHTVHSSHGTALVCTAVCSSERAHQCFLQSTHEALEQARICPCTSHGLSLIHI